MENVSSSNGLEKRPKLRFPGFDEPWEENELSHYLVENTERNRGLAFGKEDVLSVSGEYGVINQIAFQGRSFAGESVADYHVVETDDIVYTKSPLKANPYGIIKVNKGIPGIVSTLYAVYHPLNTVAPRFVDLYFANNLRLNKFLKPLVNIGAKHDMKVNNSFVLTGTVVFPSIGEQQKLVDFFAKLDRRIEAQRKIVEALKKYKRGLNRRLLSQIEESYNCKLGSVCTIMGGGTPDTLHDEYWGNSVEWFTPSEIGKTKYVNSSVRKLSNEGLSNSSAKLLPAGTVLLTTRATLGEMSIAEKECSTNQGFQSLIPLMSRVSSEYLYYMQIIIKPWCEKYASGNTFREISKSALSECIIPVPEKTQQDKIVKLLSAVDTLIAFEEKETSLLVQMKNSLLQQLFI